jgi:hypothetical protein
MFGSMHQDIDVTLIINKYFYLNSYSTYNLVLFIKISRTS